MWLMMLFKAEECGALLNPWSPLSHPIQSRSAWLGCSQEWPPPRRPARRAGCSGGSPASAAGRSGWAGRRGPLYLSWIWVSRTRCSAARRRGVERPPGGLAQRPVGWGAAQGRAWPCGAPVRRWHRSGGAGPKRRPPHTAPRERWHRGRAAWPRRCSLPCAPSRPFKGAASSSPPPSFDSFAGTAGADAAADAPLCALPSTPLPRSQPRV